MVVTRNHAVSQNFRTPSRLIRDIHCQEKLRPRLSAPNYREQSPDDFSYYQKILKVKTEGTVSHKLRIESNTRKKAIRTLHKYHLRQPKPHKSNNDSERFNDDIADDETNEENVGMNTELKTPDDESDENRELALEEVKIKELENKSIASQNKAPAVSVASSPLSPAQPPKFSHRLTRTFSRRSDIDNSPKCFESGRRYPIRLRRRPRDVYMVNINRDKKTNWNDSLTSPRIQSIFNKSRLRKLHFRSRHSDSDNSNEDVFSDEYKFDKRMQRDFLKARSELQPINMAPKEFQMETVSERNLIRSNLADIEPMTVDKNITFDMIGGNKKYIQSLKESVVLPLVYPEVFEKLSITPPRGLLFYGPPGSGKTLMARALVNECCRYNHTKIAFFMRKGADCLSKWIGESERQLRLLFDNAYRMRPSIIFFDEIDGLAPVRSSRQDQIHSSIVSTLLSLIDGLDDRGEVIVIGATNRIDSIDPALRRPGRFDREFLFTLPDENVRREILKIHTKAWKPALSIQLIENISSVTGGFSGADLKALVVESGLCAVRRRYPQIYRNPKKLELNLDEIKVTETDINVALKFVRPSSARSNLIMYSKIPDRVVQLLSKGHSMLKQNLCNFFGDGIFSDAEENDLLSVANNIVYSPLFRPRMIITGYAIEQLISGVFHELHNVNIVTFDSLYLGQNSGLSSEEKLSHIFREAEKTPKSIIHLPEIDITFHSLSLSGQNLVLQLLKRHNSDSDFNSTVTVLIATLSSTCSGEWSNVEFDDVRSSRLWEQLGKCFTSNCVNVPIPDFDDRFNYFNQLAELALRSVETDRSDESNHKSEEVLNEIEVKPRTLTNEQLLRLASEEENILRRFRIVLRKILASIAKDRSFQIFLSPVDEAEVPDYYSIISNPMDLGTMRQKVDLYIYKSFEEFRSDLHLISANALVYNPPKTNYMKDIRRHAYEFSDICSSIIDEFITPEFEQRILSIHEARLKRGYYDKCQQHAAQRSEELREYLNEINMSKFKIQEGPLLQSQLNAYQKFYKGKNENIVSEQRPQSDSEVILKKTSQSNLSNRSSSLDNLNAIDIDNDTVKSTIEILKKVKDDEPTSFDENCTKEMEIDESVEILKEDILITSPRVPALIDVFELTEVFKEAAIKTDSWSIMPLEELYFLMLKQISQFSKVSDRLTLPKDLEAIVHGFNPQIQDNLQL